MTLHYHSCPDCRGVKPCGEDDCDAVAKVGDRTYGVDVPCFFCCRRGDALGDALAFAEPWMVAS